MCETRTVLPLADRESAGASCGCGRGTTAHPGAPVEPLDGSARQTFGVTGMTCGHCVGTVAGELRALPGVTDVAIDLVPGGSSRVTVTATRRLGDGELATALAEAGGYRLG